MKSLSRDIIEDGPQLAENSRMDELTKVFSDLVTAVEEMQDSGVPPTAEDMATLAEKAGAALKGPERIDQIVTLLNRHEAEESFLRKSVKQIELRARSHAAFVKSVTSSIELFMIESGFAVIEGFAHRLKLYKKKDQLIIDKEDLIPEEFFEVEIIKQRTLNKDRLIAHLDAGKEIPGCFLQKNMRRLDIR